MLFKAAGMASTWRTRVRKRWVPGLGIAGLLHLGMLLLPPDASGQAPPGECGAGPIDEIGPERPWQGVLEVGGSAGVRTHCLQIRLEAGEFVRAVAEMEADPPFSGTRILVFPPEGSQPVAELHLGNVGRGALVFEAASSGSHHVIVRDPWTVSPGISAIPVRVRVEQIESASEVEARRAALSADPRVEWLREQAWPLRSIDPRDGDFADLEPLRGALDGVRIVLLGEVDHRSGTDFLAKTRLVKFLHRELGFDVLAFEAPMYDMSVAWARMAGAPDEDAEHQPPVTGTSARDAFALGALPFWAGAAQMQPLVEYLGEHAASPHPLEIAGFDNQPQQASIRFFSDDLAGFLEDRGIASPLGDPDAPERQVLEALAQVLYRTGREPMPAPADRRAFLDAIDRSLSGLRDFEDEETRHWSQVLRGMRCHAKRVLASETIDYCNRNDQMAENALWLATERFPERRIILWSATAHAARMPEIDPAGGSGPSMGYRIAEAFGMESYVIGVTSHHSIAGHIAPDQHPLPEFEELMAAAGFEYGLLDLRRPVARESWAGETFLSRALSHHTRPERWSDLLDALLFVREHTPSQPWTP